jgi:mono/diheme cytochrome c family protein
MVRAGSRHHLPRGISGTASADIASVHPLLRTQSMRAATLLSATAVIFAFACTKSDQTSADSLALAAKNQATLDSISAAERANATAVTTTPGDTTPASTAATPVATAPAGRPTTTGRTSPAGGSSGTKAGTTTAAKDTARGTKIGAVAAPAVGAVTSKPDAKVPAGGVAGAAAGGAIATNVPDSQGKELYEANCRKCHGVRGVPPKSMQTKFPKIATFDAAFFAKRSEDSIVTVLTKGKNEDMKSFRDKLSHEQMKAVAAYIRSFGR